MIKVDIPVSNDFLWYVRQYPKSVKGVYQRELPNSTVSGMPVGGILVSSLPNGTLISISEGFSNVLFYKGDSNYESDLNTSGRQLMVRKDCYTNLVWDSGGINAYDGSDIDIWLNNTYKNLLSDSLQKLIGTTKIKYTPGNGNNTVGVMERSIFVLSVTELGGSNPYANTEGHVLPISNQLRVSNISQWCRSPSKNGNRNVFLVSTIGDIGSAACTTNQGCRPSFTIPGDSMVSYLPNPDGSYNLIY